MIDPKTLPQAPPDPAAPYREASDAQVREALHKDEDHIPGVAIPASLEKLLGFGRSFSWWPLLFGLACCAIEMMATAGPRYDMSRFGMEAMRASPRQADGMIVAGWCSIKMAPRVVRLYEQTNRPADAARWRQRLPLEAAPTPRQHSRRPGQVLDVIPRAVP